jgi:hypothetical protein
MSAAEGTWVPLDGMLRAASGEMSSGQLIHGDGFSLFESMSAIQIMDPKAGPTRRPHISLFSSSCPQSSYSCRLVTPEAS